MRLRFVSATAFVLAAAASVSAQRQWIVYPTYYEGDQWVTVTGGDLDGRDYRYYYQAHGIMRGFWDLTSENCIPVGHTDLFPVKPAMYQVEQWAPSVRPAEVPSWDWAPIEVTFDGPGSGEEAQQNLFIPWNGQYSTNHQWIGSQLSTLQGVWKAAGPGPQAPANATCAVGGHGSQMWMKRGSTLYMKWNFPWDITAPITAVRLTEVHYDNASCTTASLGGPVDLRCIGNADPLYKLNQPFANNPERRQDTTSIDGDHALGANGYTVWVCLDPTYPWNVPLTQGLPINGQYTAQLENRNVTYQLNYDGLNTLKWKSNNTGEFATSRVFTLNGVPGREFVPGNYAKLNFLTVSSGGRGHRLVVESVYSDNSTEVDYIHLYDWFNNSGDSTAVAVGVNGLRRDAGGIGFKRISRFGDSLNRGGGDENGAFLFNHSLAVNPCKTLESVNISADFPYAPNVVVESRAGGKNYANFSTTGGWAESTAKSTTGEVTQGIGSLHAAAGQAGAAATYSFTPDVTAYYEAHATWARDLDACQQAAFTVTHDGDPVTVFHNQRQNGNEWRSLGTYHLTAGNTYTVKLDAAASTGGPRVFADAVRWHTPGISAHVIAATFEAGPCIDCNLPWADADGDGDVDATDFAFFQSCMTIGGAEIAPGCECMDSNADSSIDATDLADFAECALGPEILYIEGTNPPYWPNWPAGCSGKPE